ncbi:sensor histidine kinase [Zestomonas insulae]|nr:sensor histidine kinase [Pseudomonas insulae]
MTSEPEAPAQQPGQRPPRRRISRSTQFVLAASIILGLTMTLVGQVVSTTVERAAVQSAAEAGAVYMEAFLEPFVQELVVANELSRQSIEAIDRLMVNGSLNRHVVSVKVWRADGKVLYSTDKSMVGKTFATDEIAEALRGRIVTGLEELDEDENQFERRLNTPLYEIYAPLREFGTGRILAVGEFYEQAEALEREISNVRRQVWAVVGAATLAMLILLFVIVRRGDRIIDQQQTALHQRVREQARLHARNTVLQRRINTANHEFSRVNELTMRRIGADLHDGPAQLLTLILVMLDDFAEQQKERGEPVTDSQDSTYEVMRSAAADALREIRAISRGLVLPEIGDLTLDEELHLVAQRHEQRTSTQVRLELGSLPAHAPLPLKFCIYRFVQEGLTNAYRHAGGQGQRVSAQYRNGQLTVEVADAGPGIAKADMLAECLGNTRLGLAGMRYRVEALGGHFHVSSVPGQGTTLTAQFKL